MSKNKNYNRPISEEIEKVTEEVVEIKEASEPIKAELKKKKFKKVVIPGKLNVRKMMSLSSDIVRVLDKDTVIEVEPTDNSDWMYVEKFGGYVAAEFLSDK